MMLDWQRHRKLRIFIKTICIVLIVSFLSYDLSWAGASEVLSHKNWITSQQAQIPASIQIPLELGTIKESYVSRYNPDKLVIYIQDAHTNIEAQGNEAKLIKYLKDKYRINQVCVEGGFGEFNAGFFRGFPKDKPVREKIAAYFLSKAFISGPDYLLITEDKPPLIYGAEDKALYAAHLDIFRQNQPIVERFNQSLDKFQGVLETLKTKYYSQDLKDLDAKITSFKENKLSLTEYLSYLNKVVAACQFDLAKYPGVSDFLKLQEFEQKINFTKAETERKTLIEQLTRVLARKDLEEFIKRSLDFKVNKVAPAQYYAYLEDLALKANLSVKDYPNLLTYIKYIALSESLDIQKLFIEIGQFTKDLKAKLATAQAQKDLDSLTYILYILNGLANISLSPEEYEYFKDNRREFSQQRIAQLLSPYASVNPLSTDADITSLDDFYRFSHERDKAMVANSLSRMSQEAKAVILVAGGFHSLGITSILKEKDISYLVITPNIKTNQDAESVYFSLLKDKKLPLEEVLNDSDTLQLVNSISDTETRQRLILYWVARASRYYSLKEIKTQLNKLKLSEEDRQVVNLALKEISPRETNLASFITSLKLKSKQAGVKIAHRVKQLWKSEKGSLTLTQEKKDKKEASLQSVKTELTDTQRLAELFRAPVLNESAKAQALEILAKVLKQEGLNFALPRLGERLLLVTRQLFLRPDTKAEGLTQQFSLTKDELKDIYRILRLSKTLQDLLVTETEYSGFVHEIKDLLKYSHRLEKIFAGQVVYPVITEWHPGEKCDSNCIFCYSRGMQYKDRSQGRKPLTLEKTKELLREFAANGVAEFWVSGGKEPLTNPITSQAIKYATDLGLAVKLYTNGIRLDRTVQERILRAKQVRISLNAAISETYKQVQGINGDNFGKVVKNIKDFTKLKRQKQAKVKIGMSFLLTPYNYKEILKITTLAKELEVDFLSIRAEMVGTIRRFNADEVEEILRLVEELRINQEIGQYQGLDIDIRSVTKKDLLGEKHYLADMENPKVCRARMMKMGMSPYGVYYMCEYAEHPRNAKPELEIGDVTKMSFRQILEHSSQIQHDPSKCEACMIHEYEVNVILEKLKEDKDFGISLEDQPYVVAREETPHQPREMQTKDGTKLILIHDQQGYALPKLLLALTGLSLIGLSAPIFIAGNTLLGSLTAGLGVIVFTLIFLKPFFPQIKNFVRSKLILGTLSLGLLFSVVFGNPVPSSNINPVVPSKNIQIAPPILKPNAQILLPFYTQTEIRKQKDTYSLYINKEKSPAIFGMVYQPVPEGKHINEYRSNLAQLYKALLDRSEGGKDHAKSLHDLGITAIRIYDISLDDAQEIKNIFRKIYQKYGIRVYLSNFASLYENRNYQSQRDRQIIIDDILKIVDMYRNEPWLLGWQIGNEGNYYVSGGKFEQRINLGLPEYYSFMDEIAGVVKKRLNDDLRQQIVILGNGDLTEEEAVLISRMQNIDAVGINSFRDKSGVIDLLQLAKERISKPILISEIGIAAKTSTEQEAQSQYFKDVISILDENSIGRGKLGNVVMVFICEATDEQWKAIDTAKPEEAYLGVLGKDSEMVIKGSLSEIQKRNKSVMSPIGIESEDLIKSAWQALEAKNYGLAIKYATDAIKLWSEEAQKQQQKSVQMGRFPRTNLIKAGTKEFSGKNYDVYTREVYRYSALNDVGAAYLIIGKVAFEQGEQQKANAAFDEIINNYSYAQIQIEQDKIPQPKIVIMGEDGRPSQVFDLVEHGKIPPEIGYFKAKDTILGKENKSSPRSLSSENLTYSAWRFLVNRDYDSAVAYADKCIELYQEKAKEQQKEALNLKRPPKTEKDIWKYWALNDVGTSYFIKIRVAYEQGNKQQARQIYDELVENYNQAQVRDLEGNYWTIKKAVRRLYPDLLPGLISIDKSKAALYAFGLLVLITIRSIIGSLRSFGSSLLNLFGIKKMAKISEVPQVQNVPVMSKRDKITFLALLFVELYLMFNFVAWWFHPIRMEYYIVNFPLFGFLSYLGGVGIIFYLYVWHLLWSMQKPKYMAPQPGLKVAMATTFIDSEPIDLVKQTLLKMKQVRYPHDTFVLDESNNPQLAVFCEQNGIIHFTRKGIDKYHQPQPPFQAKTKGGNLNAWLDTYGNNYEFVTFLDPDHQPEPIFLDRILGYFGDPKVGFVQVPHIYKNYDESWIARGGAEQNYYFVGPIQMGLYGNNAAVVNGSHSTFRIKALQGIGGYGVHNADDMLTSLKLHAKGWQGIFVPEVIAEGLTPATWGPYLQQQYRWSNSMFDMLFFRYPGQFLHLKLRQILGYFMLGSFYLLQVNLLLLMILPIISVAINQPPVNLELVNFLKYFMPFYLSEMLILIGWSQKFLIRPQIEEGVWWRSGMLWVASSIYITYSFIRAIFKKGLLRTEFVTPKTTETGVSYLRLFTPHIILVGISVLTLSYTYFFDGHLWPIRGLKLFLMMSIISFTSLIITSTKWFNNWYLNRTTKITSPPEYRNIKVNQVVREEDLQMLKEAEEIASKVFDPFGKIMFVQDEKGNFTINPQVNRLIEGIISKQGQLAIEIDVDTLIDISNGSPQLKGSGFKEVVSALYENQENKNIPQVLHIRLINLNSQLNMRKIIKVLGLTEELLREAVAIVDIPEDYLIKGLEPYLIPNSTRIVFEDNLKYWGKAVDIVVKKGKEDEAISSLGLIVAALAKDPEFYAGLPQELKEYIVAVTDDKGNILLDAEARIKQLIFMPIAKEKFDTEYFKELNSTNKAL